MCAAREFPADRVSWLPQESELQKNIGQCYTVTEKESVAKVLNTRLQAIEETVENRLKAKENEDSPDLSYLDRCTY